MFRLSKISIRCRHVQHWFRVSSAQTQSSSSSLPPSSHTCLVFCPPKMYDSQSSCSAPSPPTNLFPKNGWRLEHAHGSFLRITRESHLYFLLSEEKSLKQSYVLCLSGLRFISKASRHMYMCLSRLRGTLEFFIEIMGTRLERYDGLGDVFPDPVWLEFDNQKSARSQLCVFLCCLSPWPFLGEMAIWLSKCHNKWYTYFSPSSAASLSKTPKNVLMSPRCYSLQSSSRNYRNFIIKRERIERDVLPCLSRLGA